MLSTTSILHVAAPVVVHQIVAPTQRRQSSPDLSPACLLSAAMNSFQPPSPYNVCPSLDSFGPLSVASNRHISLQPPSARGSTLLVILLTMLCMVMNHSQLVHPPTDGPRTSRQSAFRLVTPVSPGCSQSVWSRSVTQLHRCIEFGGGGVTAMLFAVCGSVGQLCVVFVSYFLV